MAESFVRIIAPAIHNGAVHFGRTETRIQWRQYATINGSMAYEITLLQLLQRQLATREYLIDGGRKCPQLCARIQFGALQVVVVLDRYPRRATIERMQK